MTKQRNGWDTWFDQWDDRYGDDVDGLSHPVQYEHLLFWGEQFRQMVMLNDHWIGYMSQESMSLEDGMTIAFILFDAGVDVDELIGLLDEFEPLEGAIARVGIPLCWLTDPMDHVQDLLGMLTGVADFEQDLIDQMRQTLEEMLGESSEEYGDFMEVFRSMSLNTAQFLMDVMRLLGDNGRLALRAWWQGRLVTLLRESATSRKRKRSGKRKKSGEVPSAFQDLIRGLDMHGLGADEESGEEE
jgi:hypothetical protein